MPLRTISASLLNAHPKPLDMTTNRTAPVADPFFKVYDRDKPAYGLRPSTELDAYLRQCPVSGAALDLGAGAGRDTVALAKAGFHVTAVDASLRGLERIRQRACHHEIAQRVETLHGDIREVDLPVAAYQAVVATTVLDHIPADDADLVWPRIIAALADEAVLYVEVHTTDDPGSPCGGGSTSDEPVSETAQWVVNYFPPGKLLRMAAESPRLRVLRYEERLEWDYTHGPEHLHGKAILLAVTAGSTPPWYGHPAAFPRKS